MAKKTCSECELLRAKCNRLDKLTVVLKGLLEHTLKEKAEAKSWSNRLAKVAAMLIEELTKRGKKGRGKGKEEDTYHAEIIRRFEDRKSYTQIVVSMVEDGMPVSRDIVAKVCGARRKLNESRAVAEAAVIEIRKILGVK